MRSPTRPSSSCDFPMPATKRSTCTVRRMRYRHSSRLFHRKCSTSRSPSYRLHDLSRDNGRLSKLIRCPFYPPKADIEIKPQNVCSDPQEQTKPRRSTKG